MNIYLIFPSIYCRMKVKNEPWYIYITTLGSDYVFWLEFSRLLFYTTFTSLDTCTWHTHRYIYLKYVWIKLGVICSRGMYPSMNHMYLGYTNSLIRLSPISLVSLLYRSSLSISRSDLFQCISISKYVLEYIWYFQIHVYNVNLWYTNSLICLFPLSLSFPSLCVMNFRIYMISKRYVSSLFDKYNNATRIEEGQTREKVF